MDVLHLNRQSPDPALIREAASALRAGKIVAFPTETVYGIGVRYDSAESIDRLKAAKGRAPDKPFTIHLADASHAERLVPFLSPPARRLAERYWPGPLTLVFPQIGDEGLGLRVVGDPIAQELLRHANVPVAATSANIAGDEPAISGADVRLRMADRVDVVLDAGPAQLQEASSVVAVATQAYRVLREGVVTGSAIERTTGETVCFLCTGNICRSPMAAALLQTMIEREAERVLGDGWKSAVRILSAGTHAMIGEGITREALMALEDFDASRNGQDHRGRMLTPELMDRADRVFVMTRQHLQTVHRQYPDLADKADLLDPDGKDVADPYLESVSVYRRTARLIHDLLLQRFFGPENNQLA